MISDTWSGLTHIQTYIQKGRGGGGVPRYTCAGRAELMIDLSEGSSRNRITISKSQIMIQCDPARQAVLW